MDTNQETDLNNQEKPSLGNNIKKLKDYFNNHPIIIILGIIFSLASLIVSVKLFYKDKGELAETSYKFKDAFCEEKAVSTKLFLNNIQISEETTIKIWSIKQNDIREDHTNKCATKNGEVCFDVCEDDKEIYISVTLLNKPEIIRNYTNIDEIPQILNLDEKY